MKLGANFLPEEFPVFIESVKTADAAGYDRAWLVDSQMLWEDVWVYMTRGLEATDNLQFGIAVTNPYTRHFSVSASAAATLGQLHPGRVILGIGRGDSAVRTLGRKQVATAKLGSIVPMMRELMAGEEIEFGGTPIHIRWARGERVPILMAATGPRNLRLAGALADIAMLQVGVNPESVEWAISHVHAGAREAGRNPSDIEISLFCGMWVSDDVEKARAETRWAAACAANHLEDVVKRNTDHGMPEVLYQVVLARSQDYDYYEGHLDSSAEHTGYLTDDLIDTFAINGSADRCLQQLRQLEAIGVSEIAPAYLNGQLDQMRTVGREIIPALAATPA